MRNFIIYKIDANGEQEETMTYLADNAKKAMVSHRYFLSMNNMYAIDSEVYPTENGFGMNVGSDTYWVNKHITTYYDRLINELITELYHCDANGDYNSIREDLTEGKYSLLEILNEFRKIVCNWIIEGTSLEGKYVPNYIDLLQIIEKLNEYADDL